MGFFGTRKKEVKEAPSSSPMAVQRIQKELKDMRKEKLDYCSAAPISDNMFKWNGIIKGPKDSPYEGGVFKLSIDLPEDYPLKAPKVKFITRVYHPNINKAGSICMDVLKSEWSPAFTITKLLISISSLLTDANPADPLEHDIAKLYQENRQKYDATVRSWTKKYAKK